MAPSRRIADMYRVLDLLKVETGLPSEAYISVKPNGVKAVVGGLVLNSNSPGDGKTHYSLAQIVSDTGGERTICRTSGRSAMLTRLHQLLSLSRERRSYYVTVLNAMAEMKPTDPGYVQLKLLHSELAESLRRIADDA